MAASKPARAKAKATSSQSGTVIRLHEASGSSRKSWEAAAAAALASAKSEVPSPVGLEVGRLWAEVRAGKVALYHATVQIAYRQRLAAPAKKAARR